jgi:hypothetical protein|nr:hypothetical protein [Methylocaldum szegediense]
MAEQTPPAISRPVFDRTITIHTKQAQRVVNHVCRPTLRSLYAIDVILRIIGKKEEIDAVEETVSKWISDCAADLEREKERMEKLCTDNGVVEKPRYTHPMDFTAQIASPQIGQFVSLIKMLDDLVIVMDTLWLTTILTNKQRSNAHYQWQQRLLRLGRRIISIEKRAHRAAYEKGRGEEVRAARESSGLAAEPEAVDFKGIETSGEDTDTSSAGEESAEEENSSSEPPEGPIEKPEKSGWRRLAGL